MASQTYVPSNWGLLGQQHLAVIRSFESGFNANHKTIIPSDVNLSG